MAKRIAKEPNDKTVIKALNTRKEGLKVTWMGVLFTAELAIEVRIQIGGARLEKQRLSAPELNYAAT